MKLIANYSYNTPAICQFEHVKNERGITLVMVLIFIVTLSLVAAVGMRGVITGDRVVANELDKNLSFQAAESAAREAVAAVTASTHTIHYGSSVTTPYIKGTAAHPQGGNAEFWRTTTALPKIADCNVATATNAKRFDWALADCSSEASSKFVDEAIYTKATKPRYVIELMPKVTQTGFDECWYRITSRASGGSNEADVILQVMFAKEVATGTVCS